MLCKDKQSLEGTKTYRDICNNLLHSPLPTPLCSTHWAVGRWLLQCNGVLHHAAGTMHRNRRDWGTHGFCNSSTICCARHVLSPSGAYARMVKHFWQKSTNINGSRLLRFFYLLFPTHFPVYSLHAPTSCLLFLVYILISFYRLTFLSCAALLFMHSLMHSTITHAQSCTVCLLMHSLVTQYIRTG